MKLTLAAGIVTALTLATAHAADAPGTTPAAKAEPAATAKSGDPAPAKKKPTPKKSVATKAADTSAAGAAPPAPTPPDPGLDVPSARARPATSATTTTGTRGPPKSGTAGIVDAPKGNVPPVPAEKSDRLPASAPAK